MSRVSWSQMAFLAALCLYGGFGSPTPDQVGLVELLVFLLLLFALRIPAFSSNPWTYAALGYGSLIPLLIGLSEGHDLGLMARDVIAFSFLFFPFFYRAHIATRAEVVLVLYGVVGVGLLFSVRTIIPYGLRIFDMDSWVGQPPIDLLYLANSPEVLLAAVFLCGTGAVKIARGAWTGLGFVVMAAVPVLAMMLLGQRASLGYFSLFAVVGLLTLLIRYPLGFLRVGLMGAGFAVVAAPLLGVLGESLFEKTRLVGLNGRQAEWRAVLDFVVADPVRCVFGFGWGAQFENPAVGGLRVNYTHSLLSALLFKTGLIGLCGIALPVAVFCRRIFADWTFALRSSDQRGGAGWTPFGFVTLAALLGPLLIAGGLYASYKSLGFGLILLIFIGVFGNRNLEKNQPVMP